MSDKVFNVLFLCTGNSARSILAESALNKRGGNFRAFSAGSHPKGTVNPDAIALLERIGYPTEGLHSKGWEAFSEPDSPVMDFVFTVCDDAAGEVCPIWPGHPMTAHWGIEDPSHVEGNEIERERAFVKALRYLENRIDLFTALPIGKLEERVLATKLKDIGRTEGATVERLEDAR
ncbi:arsenate reductase ArsC (plasmid) [Sphingomonas sp. AP4-R1]|uniref:arsenate reductase ArsC n=1 Tax=Sphingomonas sp. AP4-R1 TaxID=2735134 RepID=UPI00149383D4|nr:arsenate reductase ArsC [Sphingomonas sp. AP4-R1]QJU60948.1 arsenate reductase ArsC [Sphingomonas sp. AP4-R1]